MFKNFSLSYLNLFAMIVIAILFSFDAFSKISERKLLQINTLSFEKINNS